MPARKSSNPVAVNKIAARKTVAKNTSLSDDRQVGKATPPIYLYGWHAVVAALRNPQRENLSLLTTEQGADALNTYLNKNSDSVSGKLPLRVTKRAELNHLLGSQTVHQGILLETRPLPNPDWQQARATWKKQHRACLVVLDQVTDPHHVGSVLRSAAVFGAVGVIMQDRHSPPESGALAKAASGALEAIPLFRVANLSRTLSTLQTDGFWCIGLDPESDQEITSAGGYEKSALVIGAEGRGLRRLTTLFCDLLARLAPQPQTPETPDSLSVSTAAAVALYAIHRSG